MKNEYRPGLSALVESRRLRRLRRMLTGILLLIAFAVRLPHSNQPPLDFHATRQYRSLVIARSLYLETQPGVPEWRKNIARLNAQREGILEPPVMEYIVALVYRLAGGEHFWIPKLLSSVFWIFGGIFLYLIAGRITTGAGALFSLAFYSLLPFAVTASQSFQPDPLMILIMLASIWAILRDYEEPTRPKLWLAAIISASAIFVKPVCMFMILGAFFALSFYRYGLKGSIRRSSLVFLGISFLPIFTFYVYGIFIAGFLRTQADASFLPQLLLDPFFWKNWLNNIRLVIGFTFFVAALAGTLLVHLEMPRAFMTGLWAGYFLFTLVFSYHVATHDYYQIQLIPLAALSLGPLFELIWDQIHRSSQPWLWRFTAWGIPILAVMLNAGLIISRPADPSLENRVKTAEAIGEQVHHSTQTLFLSSDYGVPLKYHGELSGEPWPIMSDLEWERLAHIDALDAEERFNRSYRQDAPEYFIVLDFDELEGQGDLKEFLFQSFPVAAQNDGYLIFDLRSNQARN